MSRRSKYRQSAWPPFVRSPIFRVVLGALGLGVVLTVAGFGFAAQQESQDTFCASCHTQPESTFYQRSVDAQPVDLASAHTAHTTRCIDCHSGEGVTGRLQAELLGAHNALAFFTGTAVQPAMLTNRVGDGSCLKCHQDVTASQNRNNHFHYFLARWQAIDSQAATCVSCHGGHSTDGTADSRFMTNLRVQTVCDACHQRAGEGG